MVTWLGDILLKTKDVITDFLIWHKNNIKTVPKIIMVEKQYAETWRSCELGNLNGREVNASLCRELQDFILSCSENLDITPNV